MPRKKNYTLTAQAESDLRQAKTWSLARWGRELSKKYFADLHKGAQYIAANHQSLCARDELAAGTGLSVYPVREHYIIYLPISGKHILTVAFIRQGRNIPNILSRNSYLIQQEVRDIQERIAQGKLKIR